MRLRGSWKPAVLKNCWRWLFGGHFVFDSRWYVARWRISRPMLVLGPGELLVRRKVRLVRVSVTRGLFDVEARVVGILGNR